MKTKCLKKILVLFALLCWAVGVDAQDDYTMAGPYEVVARDGQFRGSKGGSERDMKAAYDFAVKGEAEKAVAILPTLDKFEADSPYANGNWGAIVNRQRMACAIFLEDTAKVNATCFLTTSASRTFTKAAPCK